MAIVEALAGNIGGSGSKSNVVEPSYHVEIQKGEKPVDLLTEL